MKEAKTFLDGFGDYLRAQGKQPATVESYSRDARRFLDYLSTHKLPPTRVEPETLIAYREMITADERENSVRRSIIGVRMFYRYLTSTKLIVNSPFDEVPIPQRNDALPGKLYNEEIESVIDHVTHNPSTFTDLRNAVIVCLLSFEGLKANELIGLTWSDYLPGNPSSLRIRGGKARSIKLSPETSDLLEHYRQLFKEISSHPAMSGSSEKCILVAFRGRDATTPIPKMTRHGLKFIVYELGKAAGVGHLNSELLRHYAVSHLLSLGRGPEEIMQHLGLRRLGNIGKHVNQVRRLEQQY